MFKDHWKLKRSYLKVFMAEIAQAVNDQCNGDIIAEREIIEISDS